MSSKSYLLDTHCLLWFLEGDRRLSVKSKNIIENPQNSIFFSQISLFEIAIKQSIGKLPNFKAATAEIYHQSIATGISFLQLQNSHIEAYKMVPLFDNHRDPFDRLLLATAYHENAYILSVDENFKLYKEFVEVIW